MNITSIKTAIRRFLNRKLSLSHPASYPYLSGDGFRAVANFAYDQFADFDPSAVRHGDVIFVRGNILGAFFEKVHPRIAASYTLISHNEDSTVTETFSRYLDEANPCGAHILHWFAENLFFKHPRATVLPIGIQNWSVGHPDNFVHAFAALQHSANPNGHAAQDAGEGRKNRILFAFAMVADNADRSGAREVAVGPGKHISDWVSLPRTEYYKALSTYKFIASPRGNGIDCHRTWEALYFKTVPILIRNSWSEQIEASGFPVLLIDNWSDIASMNEAFLDEFYAKAEAGFGLEKLFLPYWYDIIKKP